MADVTITFQATTDERYAPIAVYDHPDGSRTIRRDNVEPDKHFTGFSYMPHGIVLVDGEPSAFDEVTAAPPIDDTSRSISLKCRLCGTVVVMSTVSGSLPAGAFKDWYFTSDTGWLCPPCSPKEGSHGRSNDHARQG